VSGKFEGKSVLVTGANSGIGLATAQYFAAEGATVFATGRRQDQLDRAVELIGKNAIGVQGDITKAADLERLFATIKRKVDKLDVVVANAGAAIFATLEQYTHEILDETFGLNLKGTAFTVQGALPLMPDGATVVLVSSIEGLRGSPGLGVYAATKAALHSFARTWAAELRSRGIRVNAISPGVVFTPAYETAGVTLESLKPLLPAIPLGRLGTVEEIAKAIGFLASSDSSYITAADLIVDGGLIDVSSGIRS
jgi:Dehydrogenases with different specificities (related to short-chain alcohol dehydrogenases)